MSKKTLADKVLKGFSRIKVRKVNVKVPILKIRGIDVRTSRQKKAGIPISSVVNILIKAAVEKAKRERKEKTIAEDKSYSFLKEEKQISRGYGTVPKVYGSTPHTSYADYGKLFSYLGRFRAKQPYENMAEHVEVLNQSTESSSFTLIDKETMDKGTRYVRYFHPKVPVDKTSLVPLPGMSSAEWEEFKWFMRLDTPLYLLKTSTS